MASSKSKGRVSLDERFYLSADDFFPANAGLGLTYDDVSLATRYSEVLPRMTRLDSSLSDALSLSLPIVSSDMDTVTEHRMAIAMALNGGLGLLHYNMPEADQVAEVRRVKNHIHGMIGDPAVVSADDTIAQVLARIEHDALAISTAHGHTKGVGDALRILRKAHKGITLIAGNVTSGEGVEFLAAAGADTVKIGQGPGSICTTRIVAGVGIPQLTALYVASRAAAKKGVRILADGGITKSGDIVKALTLADAVILGGLLAGSREAPGKLMEINGKTYKEYRGMGSHEAMRKGSAARYGHSASGKFSKVAAEGIEALKEVSGTVDQVLGTLAGGVQSGLGYLGAANLAEHRKRARYIRVTPAGQREAAPHDVIEIKAGS